MGWCAEFGVRIHDACGQPMAAGRTSCRCDVCGTECAGRYAGCKEVWAAGPRTHAPHRGIRSGSALVVHPTVAETVEPDTAASLEDVVVSVATLGRQLKAVYTIFQGAERARAESDDTLSSLRAAVDAIASDLRSIADAVGELDRTVADLPDIRAGIDKVSQVQADLVGLLESRRTAPSPRSAQIWEQLGKRPAWQSTNASAGERSDDGPAPSPGDRQDTSTAPDGLSLDQRRRVNDDPLAPGSNGIPEATGIHQGEVL